MRLNYEKTPKRIQQTWEMMLLLMSRLMLLLLLLLAGLGVIFSDFLFWALVDRGDSCWPGLLLLLLLLLPAGHVQIYFPAGQNVSFIRKVSFGEPKQVGQFER